MPRRNKTSGKMWMCAILNYLSSLTQPPSPHQPKHNLNPGWVHSPNPSAKPDPEFILFWAAHKHIQVVKPAVWPPFYGRLAISGCPSQTYHSVQTNKDLVKTWKPPIGTILELTLNTPSTWPLSAQKTCIFLTDRAKYNRDVITQNRGSVW